MAFFPHVISTCHAKSVFTLEKQNQWDLRWINPSASDAPGTITVIIWHFIRILRCTDWFGERQQKGEKYSLPSTLSTRLSCWLSSGIPMPPSLSSIPLNAFILNCGLMSLWNFFLWSLRITAANFPILPALNLTCGGTAGADCFTAILLPLIRRGSRKQPWIYTAYYPKGCGFVTL